MEWNSQSFEFIWLPPEEELSEVTSLLQSKLQESFPKKGPLTALKSFIAKLLNASVKICDLKRKIALGSTEEYCISKTDTPLAMFYTEYLYKVSAVIISEGTNVHTYNIEKLRKVLKAFCCERSRNNFPELWLSIDTSIFIDNPLSTKNYFIDLKGFSLGNLVKLNTFVEHFNCNSSLETYNYKITQVKVKFLHDEQMMHVHFVVGNSGVSLKKRSAKSHRMFKLNIPYSSIHTVLLCYSDVFAVYFRLYKSPMLFAVEQDEESENYISYMDLKNNTKWIRTVNILKNCPPSLRKEFSMNYVLKLIFCHEHYEVLKLILHHKGIQFYFTPMSVVSYKQVTLPFQFDDFDCFYGSRCLLTHGNEILDHLMNKEELDKVKAFAIKKSTENPKALSEAFYMIHSAISQCNIILLSISLKTLYERLSQFGSIYINNDNNDSKQRTLMIKRAVVCPTHVRFLPPQPILKNRALRNCSPEFSLRISIRDVNFETINFSFKANQDKKMFLKDFFNKHFKPTLLDGIKIGKRCYEYVGSSTSQFRGHGLWFYAEDSNGITANTLRENFGELDKIKQVPKFMARMGQTFSQAMDHIVIPQELTNVDNPEKDVTGGVKQYLTDEDLYGKKFLKPLHDDKVPLEEPYVFSDGIGRVSYDIANEVYKKLGVEETRPSAMQIRYAGCKGMLVVDPHLKGKKIIFRESMKKFNSASNSLEILKLSEKRIAALNRPLITILEQLGVSKDVIIKLQKDMIQNHIKSMFHEDDACNFLNRHSQLRFDFFGMHETGIRFTEDPLFRSMIYGLFRKNLDLLKNKASIEIPVNKGRSMFGVLDETFTLEYGQVFIQYSEWISDKPEIVTGPVVVTKNPCMHPGDVRKFQAVDVEDLHHIRDCIVFPAKGPRPHPDEMAGSDLDGDEYHVMWFEGFFFERDNEDAMLYAMHKDHAKDLERMIEPSDELDHLCDYILNDNVGLIANAHLVFADKNKQGIFSENCIRLARKYAIALDFAKSGIPATRDRRDRCFSYPDFMQKIGEKNTYLSRKVLGVLYRNCKCLEMGLETENSEVEYKVDMDLIYKNWEIYEKSALRHYKMYCKKVENLISIFSFDNEGELLAGAIINPPKYYEQRHDLENLKVLLEYEVQSIFYNLEKQFFSEFDGKPIDKQYSEKMYQKASAWYAITYGYDNNTNNTKKNRYFGFPWAVSDVLKKLKSEKCLHKGYKSANQKSLLAEIVDRSLSSYLPKADQDTEIKVIYENRSEVLDVAKRVLIKWLKTQREIFMISDFKVFEKLVETEFRRVSSPLMSCNLQYIEKLKNRNCLHYAISPFHYIIETLLHIASVKTTKQKNIPFMSSEQELGLLSWLTLIKLACTYNPQYLGIPNKDGKYASSVFYVPQDNVISTFRLPLFEEKREANPEFSSALIKDSTSKIVTEYIKEQTKIKDIDFRFDTEQENGFVAIFTVMGSRFAIERLKDLVVQDDFFNKIVKEIADNAL